MIYCNARFDMTSCSSPLVTTSRVHAIWPLDAAVKVELSQICWHWSSLLSKKSLYLLYGCALTSKVCTSPRAVIHTILRINSHYFPKQYQLLGVCSLNALCLPSDMKWIAVYYLNEFLTWKCHKETPDACRIYSYNSSRRSRFIQMFCSKWSKLTCQVELSVLKRRRKVTAQCTLWLSLERFVLFMR